MKDVKFQWRRFLIYMALAILLVVVEINLAKRVEILIREQSVLHQADAQKNRIGYQGYAVNGNKYTAQNEDPQIMIENNLKNTSRVKVTFVREIQKRMKFQVYYHVEGQGFSEENSQTDYIESGAREAEIEIPEGNYSMLRLDIDGDFELDSIDFYGLRESDITMTQKLIIGFVAICIFLGIAFLVYRRDREFFQQLAGICLKRIRNYHFTEYNYQGIGDFLRRFLIIYLPVVLLGIIYVNSRYINPNAYNRYDWTGGVLITGVSGYTESESTYHYNEDEECYVTLVGGENLSKILLEMNTFADKDITISYRLVNASGSTGEKGKVIWKAGTLVIAIDAAQDNYSGIQLFVPTDFSMNRAYYISDNALQISAFAQHAKVQLILLVVVLIILSTGFGKYFTVKCVMCMGKVKEGITENRKKIILFLGVMCVSVLLGLGMLKIFEARNICEWNTKSVVFCVLIAWLCAAIICLNKHFVQKAEVIGFIVVLLVGSFFALIAPGNVGLSWDDQIHYDYAVKLSNVGNDMRAYSDQIIDEYVYSIRPNYGRGWQKSSYEIIDTLEKERCYVENQGVHWNAFQTWVPYIPNAAGMILARGLGMPYHLQLILGRWMNILLLAVLCYFAMRKLKNGKIVVLLMALIPTNIFIASNYTYDTWMIGWIVLSFSLFMGELQERDSKITWKSMITIAGAMFLAIIPKMVYFPMILLVLFMPKRKFASRRQQFGYYAIIFGGIFLLFLLLYVNTFGGSSGGGAVSDARGGENVNGDMQIDYIKNNFRQFTQTIYLFLRDYLNPIKNGGGYLTFLAYVANEIKVSYTVIIWTIAAGAIFHHEDDARIPWWYRIGTICMYVGIGIVCSVSMYIIFTEVGAGQVAGCQPRYLLPVLFPTVYVLSRIPFRTKIKTWMEEKGLTRMIDVILLGIIAYADVMAVWEFYIMRY